MSVALRVDCSDYMLVALSVDWKAATMGMKSVVYLVVGMVFLMVLKKAAGLVF